MQGSYYKPYCKCENKKRCTCDATWYYHISHGPIDPKTGKHKPIKKGGFKTRKEAEAACRKVIDEIENGTFIKETDEIFEVYAAQWLIDYSNDPEIKEPSTRTRRTQIRRLNKYLAKLKMKNITHKVYKNVINEMVDKGYTANTISGTHAAARLIFGKAKKEGSIKIDPTENIVLPKKKISVEELETQEEIDKYLEKEELAKFLNTAKQKGKPQDYCIFLLMSYTGMRIGEVLALKWRDIDFDEGVISITKTLYRDSSKTVTYKLETPKTRKSKRIIAIDETVLEELKNHRSEQNILKMKYRDRWHDKDFVFTAKNFPGYPMVDIIVRDHLRSLLKKSGLNPDLTPHTLRHTHTSLLAEAGVSLEEIMERLGHEDDKTTRRIYLHVTKSMKKEASRKFSELMKNTLKMPT